MLGSEGFTEQTGKQETRRMARKGSKTLLMLYSTTRDFNANQKRYTLSGYNWGLLQLLNSVVK